MDSQDQAVIIWIYCVVILCFKMYAVGVYTGIMRFVKKQPAMPEDVSLMRAEVYEESTNPAVLKGLNMHRNDTENVYIYFFLSLIFPLATVPGSGTSALTAWNCFNLIFTVSRLLYSLCYAFGLQPWRTIVFNVGQITCVIFGIWSLVSVFDSVSHYPRFF